jgi:hypothetical protein
MGDDKRALFQLWQEKRGEIEPPDLSDVLIVQLGLVTEDLNRRWFERNSGRTVHSVQYRAYHRHLSWLAATVDGIVDNPSSVFEAKFMLPWSFSEEAAITKYMPQLQHNMLAADCSHSVLSIITGGGKWIEISVLADPIYQAVLVEAERRFWEAVQSGDEPSIFSAEPPRPRIEAVRVVDMTNSNSWADFAGAFLRTHQAHLEHEHAKGELKSLMPPDAKEAMGHGVRAKRSKSGAISFDLLEMGETHASL